jgi:two-component system, OmpR family, response regulator CpxR
MPGTKLLLIDDDKAYCTSLARLLAMEGFEVEVAHTAEAGFASATGQQHELVLLDVMLSPGDGRKVLQRIRTVSQVPVIMLTARGDEADRISGLEGGADDYLPKPFHPRELIARIRSVLRRRSAPMPANVIAIGDLEIHPGSRLVLQTKEGEGQQDVLLTGAEFDLLLLLVRAAGEVLSRDDLAQGALGRNVAPFDRSIDNHISSLRKKLGNKVDGVERLRSVRGNGYVYANQSRSEPE